MYTKNTTRKEDKKNKKSNVKKEKIHQQELPVIQIYRKRNLYVVKNFEPTSTVV